MTFLNTYKKYTSVSGNNPKDSLTKTFIRDTNALMKTNPSYFEVSINDSPPVPSLIVDDSKTEDLKVISLAPSHVLQRGDYIEWDNKLWLTLIVDHQGNIYYRGRIAQCSFETLKWIDDEGEIREYPCVFYFNTKSNFGVSSDKIMVLPDGRRQIVVQANEDTLNIKHNMRFIFNNRAWKIIDYDFVDYEGLVNISLEEDTVNKFTDNIEERLANYDRLAKYSIEIQNKTLILRQGDTVQLNVVVKRNVVLLPHSPEDLIFESSDESIVTVNESGLVTAIMDGQCEITVKIKGNEDLSDVATVEVGEILEDKSIIIIGEDEIRYYSEETYIAKVYEGTNEIVEDVTWSITSGNQYVNILSQNGNSITLEAKSSSGNVKLVAILVSDNSVIAEKQIRVKSLW